MLKQKALPRSVQRNHSQLRQYQTQQVQMDVQSSSDANLHVEQRYVDQAPESRHSTLAASKTVEQGLNRAAQQQSSQFVPFKGMPNVKV